MPENTKQLRNLRLVRVQIGLSQRELSRRTMPVVSQARISLFEAGMPASDGEATALATAMGVDVAELARRPRPLRRRAELETIAS